MRRIVALLVAAVLFGPSTNGPAFAQTGKAKPSAKASSPAARPAPAPAPAPSAANVKRMDELLREWEQQSAQTKTLDATFKRIDTDVAFAQQTEYEGRALLKAPNLAWLDFGKIVVAGKKPAFHERIICDGQKVFQFVAVTRQIFVFPLDPKEKQRALEEGPLPFLFNMKANDAKARYNMLFQKENKSQCLIEIRPLQPVDREAFSTAYIWLNKETFLPDKLKLVDPNNGKDTKVFEFIKITRNASVPEHAFDGELWAKRFTQLKWDRVNNPGADGRPQQQAGRGARPAPRRQAAEAQPREAQQPRAATPR